MKRREFLQNSSLCLAAVALPSFLKEMIEVISSDPSINIRDYFKWNNEEIIVLTENVYRDCILNKIKPPQGVLRGRWITPGGEYNGQWIWDTMFVANLLSILDGQKEVIREVFKNFRDAQNRWDNVKPEHQRGMIPCMIIPDYEYWAQFPAYTQIPILAWGLEEIYKKNGDIELVHSNLKSTEEFHEWYWREQDITDIGLIGVGAYTGDIQHAKFETFDFDGSLDDLKLTKHPSTHNIYKGAWYGDVLVTGNTSFLLMGERSLERLALLVGDREMAERRRRRIDKCVEAMRRYMWNEEEGTFMAVHRDTLEQIPMKSIGCWMPLMAGVPTQEMAERIAQTLSSPA